jgi:molybdenum cofactor biosynthesis enzyme MoaA
MACVHCVAKEFDGIVDDDLVLSDSLISWINESRCPLVVLTGGEPLLHPHDEKSCQLIRALSNKSIVVDTNGTITPPSHVLECLREHDVMVRVSMDSTSSAEEVYLRRAPGGGRDASLWCYHDKLRRIEWFVDSGLFTTVQTVVWRKNTEAVMKMADWLAERHVRQWYLQRLIETNRFQRRDHARGWMTPEQYIDTVSEIQRGSSQAGVECIAKKDLRHDSVFLLTGRGLLFTQGVAPGEKVRLGTVLDHIDYFDRVSAADHAARYYLTDGPHGSGQGYHRPPRRRRLPRSRGAAQAPVRGTRSR